MKTSPIARRVISAVLLLAAALLLCLALFLIPRHTAPEYAAASYDDLANKVRDLCVLPPKEAIPSGDSSYVVYLKSRFSNKAVGYLVSFAPPDGCAKWITVSCKLLSELPKDHRSITPTESYGEVDLAVRQEHLAFILNGVLYDIHGIDATDKFSQRAGEIARSIIDARDEASKSKRSISGFLNENDIAFSEASVNGHVLSVSLLSEGEDRCTLEDVKSIVRIYGAVHEDAIEGEVKDVSIKIYDRNGALIYDARESVVSAPVDGPEGQNGRMDAQDDRSEQDVLEKVYELISSFNYSTQPSSKIKAVEVKGKKLVITLTKDGFDFLSIDRMFDRLEALLAEGGDYTQCEITMVDTKGKCVYYMAGDFAFGSRIAWISPAAESAFLDQVGPKRD